MIIIYDMYNCTVEWLILKTERYLMQREACLWLLSHVFLCFPLWDVIFGRGILGLLGLKSCVPADGCLAPRMINAVLASSVTFGPEAQFGEFGVTWGLHAALWDDFTLFYNDLPSQRVKWRNFDNFDFEIFWTNLTYQATESLDTFGITRLTWLTQPTRQRKNSQEAQQEAQQAAPKYPEMPRTFGSRSLRIFFPRPED